MIETFDRLVMVLAGERLSKVVEVNDNFTYLTVADGPLSGVNIIPGFDRVREPLSDKAYPYILIDLIAEEPEPTRQALKKVSFSLDLAVYEPARSFAAIFGWKNRRGILSLARDLRGHLKQHETLKDASGIWAFGFQIGATQYQVGVTEKGTTNGKRYAAMTVTYWVPNENERT